jgi:hypothetical protein
MSQLVLTGGAIGWNKTTFTCFEVPPALVARADQVIE